MHEPPPDLPDELLVGGLRAHYGLAVTAVSFLPLGHDALAWVYRARTADGASYFLKVRTGVTNEPGLLVPRYLHDRGVAQAVAPLPTNTGALWATLGRYALILYPFIDGATGMERGMSPRQWIDYGAILHRIHATAVAAELAQRMQRETFVPVGAALVRKVEAHLDGRRFADPAARKLAGIWRERRDTIQTLAARAEELGRRLAQTAPPFVLCHADIHTNNVMLDGQGRVWIVDWDETVLAPRERDLMFVVGGGIDRALVGPAEEELFLQGYGAATLDPLALAYYRYAWAVGDVGAYADEVYFRPDLGALSRRVALERFRSLFEPGRIVPLALASDEGVA